MEVISTTGGSPHLLFIIPQSLHWTNVFPVSVLFWIDFKVARHRTRTRNHPLFHRSSLTPSRGSLVFTSALQGELTCCGSITYTIPTCCSVQFELGFGVIETNLNLSEQVPRALSFLSLFKNPILLYPWVHLQLWVYLTLLTPNITFGQGGGEQQNSSNPNHYKNQKTGTKLYPSERKRLLGSYRRYSFSQTSSSARFIRLVRWKTKATMK